MSALSLNALVFLIMAQLIAIGWHWRSDEQGATANMILDFVRLVLLVFALVCTPLVRS